MNVFLCIFSFIFLTRSIFCTEFVYVTNVSNNNVSVYSIDNSTGALTEINGSPFAAGAAPETIAITPNNKFAYVANALSDTISAYSISPTGSLTQITGSPFNSGGVGPAGIAITPDGQFIYITNTDGPFNPSIVSGFTIDNLTGALTPIAGSPFTAGIGPSGIAITLDQQFVYVANFTSNNISGYSINPVSGALTPVAGSPFPAGLNPFEIAITPDGKFLYATNTSGSNISAYSIGLTGSLTSIGTAPTGSDPIGIVITPDGKFVYVENETANNIFAFSINDISGAITFIQSVGGGGGPINGAITPDTKSFYVTNEANSISAYSINSSTGILTPLAGFPFAALSPRGIAIISLAPPSPINFIGRQRRNDFGLIFELYNDLKWQKSSSLVIGYNLYRDGIKIATLSPSTLQYQDHNRKKEVTTIYSLTSFTSDGLESLPITIVVYSIYD